MYVSFAWKMISERDIISIKFLFQRSPVVITCNTNTVKHKESCDSFGLRTSLIHDCLKVNCMLLNYATSSLLWCSYIWTCDIMLVWFLEGSAKVNYIFCCSGCWHMSLACEFQHAMPWIIRTSATLLSGGVILLPEQWVRSLSK